MAWNGRLAQGNERKGNLIQVSLTLDPDTFAEIKNIAAKRKQSFAETVRELLEWGLIHASS